MTELTTAEPSAEELATATAVLARKMASDQARSQVFAGDPAFETMLASVTDLRAGLLSGSQIYNHVTAIFAGMTNLKNDLARATAA